MASSSGITTTSSGGSGSGSGSGLYPVQSSGSEPDLQHLMDQRKQKRMISNRESARRSRKRKQKHLDDLTAQVSQLRKVNDDIMANVSITTQHYMSVEAENHVLQVQVAELSHHLQSLNDIIALIQSSMDPTGFTDEQYGWGSGNASYY
ncbi:putative transcription factor bZIP family [Helianthus debilis subsp. tardiflorus]